MDHLQIGPYGDCQPFWNAFDGSIGGDVEVWIDKWGRGDGFSELPQEDWRWVIEWTGPNLLNEKGEVQACDCNSCKGELSIYSHYVLEYNMAGEHVKRDVTMNLITLPFGRGKRPKDVIVTVVRKEVQDDGE